MTALGLDREKKFKKIKFFLKNTCIFATKELQYDYKVEESGEKWNGNGEEGMRDVYR